MNEEYTLEKFKHFIELLGESNPTSKYLKGFADRWEEQLQDYNDFIKEVYEVYKRED